MQIDPLKPFDIFKDNEQELIKNSFSKHRYDYLQSILRYFAGEITKEQLPDEIKHMEDYQIKDSYCYHFTVLFGDLLCQIGSNFQTANPTIQFDFDKLKEPVENNKEALCNRDRMMKLMLDNGRTFLYLDTYLSTRYGDISAVSINFFEYRNDEEGNYSELEDNEFEQLYSAVEEKLKTIKSQGL